jgi:hypothetical protein
VSGAPKADDVRERRAPCWVFNRTSARRRQNGRSRPLVWSCGLRFENTPDTSEAFVRRLMNRMSYSTRYTGRIHAPGRLPAPTPSDARSRAGFVWSVARSFALDAAETLTLASTTRGRRCGKPRPDQVLTLSLSPLSDRGSRSATIHSVSATECEVGNESEQGVRRAWFDEVPFATARSHFCDVARAFVGAQ